MKIFRSTALAAASAGLLLAACAQKQAPALTEGVPEEVIAGFVAAMDEFNPEAVRAVFTPNAKVMPPNVASITGIDDIVEYYKGSLADELDFEFTRDASAMAAGGLSAAEGSYKVRNKVSGEYIEQGKWMAVFVNVDGTWRVARFMTNTDAPVAAPTVDVEESEAGGE